MSRPSIRDFRLLSGLGGGSVVWAPAETVKIKSANRKLMKTSYSATKRIRNYIFVALKNLMKERFMESFEQVGLGKHGHGDCYVPPRVLRQRGQGACRLGIPLGPLFNCIK